MLPPTAVTARVLLLAEDSSPAEATEDSRSIVVEDGTSLGDTMRGLCLGAALDASTVLLRVDETTADSVATALPDLLVQLPALQVAVLMGPLASETWRRQAAFQLHLTLVDTPEPLTTDLDAAAQVRSALTGVAAMAG